MQASAEDALGLTGEHLDRAELHPRTQGHCHRRPQSWPDRHAARADRLLSQSPARRPRRRPSQSCRERIRKKSASPGPAAMSVTSPIITASRASGCSSNTTTPSAAPITSTPSGAISPTTSAAMFWHGTMPKILMCHRHMDNFKDTALGADVEFSGRELETAGLDGLMAEAAAVRDRRWGRVITYSRKVFVPLTNMCRDTCGYCVFVKHPSSPEARIMTPDEVKKVVLAGERLACKEVLFSLGEKAGASLRSGQGSFCANSVTSA